MNIKNFIKIFPLKITFMGFLFLVALTSCDDENNLLVTEKEIKQTNSRFELSLKIDPDIVYSNSSTKLITSIKRLVPKDSLGSDPTMYCKLNTVGGNLDMHSELYSFNGQSYPGYLNVSISDSANSVWEGLAFFIPSLPLKDTGHISAIFDGMNLTLPIKLVPTP
ncbi:MAG: hypothetical protein CMF88_07410 [Candidatus Marinimicrobia bacterium]|nr:hypothetical protein [Candidatus Neomarinimicrobiota bacterium]|tara:strand:- start:230 stop:724 length:495 start_codon:yes stop_codon:yes gene_type:complete